MRVRPRMEREVEALAAELSVDPLTVDSLRVSRGIRTSTQMKVVSWNIKGLGGDMKRRLLRRLVRAQKPHIFLLQETKIALLDVTFIRSF
ncbi:hypothetical protein AMTR_s00055p00181930 [Amborella trichopoda]|uniref:Endonuclease/exonuclease/phosphatase domain-containing protein n=1 Tax=Amborella trichopoda TaxID=13333 RepID=U5DD19_AMBTC|nr:hypothetical protein AMTR_s00055p00181930 [Amborella trichopoda]